MTTNPAGNAEPGTGCEWQPRLAPGAVVRYDRTRGTDLLVMPERVAVLRGQAGTVLGLCDGERDVHRIIGDLTARFPGAAVAAEVPVFLDRLRAEGWLR